MIEFSEVVDNFTANPDTYEAMAEPYESVEAGEAALDAFHRELKELREKHGIAECCAIAAVYLEPEATEDDKRTVPGISGMTMMGDVFRGSQLCVELAKSAKKMAIKHMMEELKSMAAEAKGEESEKNAEAMIDTES
jgi:hypothetical protein